MALAVDHTVLTGNAGEEIPGEECGEQSGEAEEGGDGLERDAEWAREFHGVDDAGIGGNWRWG